MQLHNSERWALWNLENYRVLGSGTNLTWRLQDVRSETWVWVTSGESEARRQNRSDWQIDVIRGRTKINEIKNVYRVLWICKVVCLWRNINWQDHYLIFNLRHLGNLNYFKNVTFYKQWYVLKQTFHFLVYFADFKKSGRIFPLSVEL